MQKVPFEFPFGANAVSLHCPACGAVAMDEAHFAETPCKHLIFAFLDEVGDFSYIAPELEKLLEKLSDDEDQVDGLCKRIKSKTAICLGVTTSGMACGPVSSTAWLGFDLCPGKPKTTRPKRNKS